MLGRSLTSALYEATRFSTSGRAIRRDYAPRGARNVIIGRTLGRVGWRPRRRSELSKKLAGRVAEKARQEEIDTEILAGQGGRCAACGEVLSRPHRDGEHEKVLCDDCHFIIEDARERYETPELAAKRLTAAALYLTTTAGGDE